MSLLITTGIVLLVSVLLITVLWPWIRSFYMDHIAPFVEKHCGSDAKKICDDVFCFLNKDITITRRTAKDLWQKFVSIIRRFKTTYTRIDSENYRKTSSTVIITQDGKVLSEEVSETINESLIPDEIRQQLYDSGEDQGVLDSREIIQRKFDQEMKLLNAN